MFISRHVVFDEDIFPHLDKRHSSTNLASNQSSGTISSNTVPLISHTQHFNFNPTVIPTNSLQPLSPHTESPSLQISDAVLSIPTETPIPGPSSIETPIPTPFSTNHVSLSDSSSHLTLLISSPKMSPLLPRQIVTGSKIGNLKPKEFPDFKTFYST